MESTHSPIRCCCLTGYAPTLLNHHESRLSSEFLHWVALRAFLFTSKPQPPPPRAVVYLSLLLILFKPSVTSPIHRLQWQWGTVCDCDPHNTKPSLSSSLSDKNKMFTTINEMWNGRMGRRQTAIRTPMRRSNPITSSVHQSIVHRELQRVFFVVLNEWVIHDYVLGYCLTLSLFRCSWCSALFSKPNVPQVPSTNPSPVPDNLPSVRLPSSSGSALTRTSMPRRLFSSRDSITDSAAMVNRFLVDAYVHVHHRESGMVCAVQRQSTMKEREWVFGWGRVDLYWGGPSVNAVQRDTNIQEPW